MVGTSDNEPSAAVIKNIAGDDVTSSYNIIYENGTLEITPAQVTVTADDKWKYFGQGDPELTAVVSGGLVAGDEIEYDVDRVAGEEVGSYDIIPSGPHTQGNYQVSYVNGTLTIVDATDPGLACPSGDGLTKKYDAIALAPVATATAPGASIEYKSSTDGGLTWTDWSDAPASITQAGTLDVQAKVTAPSFETATCTYTLTITPRIVTLTSATDSREYNGNVLTNDEVTVGGDGFVAGEGATYDVTGEQLLPGTSDNTFTYTLNSGTQVDDYTITTILGTLTVTDRTTPYEITMTAKSNSMPIIYDGLEHTVSDFMTHTFTVEGNTYTVTGLDATVTEVFAGTYENVVTGTPVVKDAYDNDVTGQFTVNTENGSLTISKRNISFSIDEETATKIYDGAPLTVTFDQLQVDGLANTDELIGGTITTSGSEVGDYPIADGNMFYMMSAGTSIKSGFKIKHDPSGELAKALASYTPSFSITLKISSIPCEGVTYQGHDYPAVLIGTQCWLAENLRNTATAAGPISYVAYNEDDANAAAFGYLYTWYTAVGVPEGDNTTAPTTATTTSGETYVQGICPDGWAIPSHTDMEILKNFASGEVRRLRDMSTSYWIGGSEGVTPNYGFNSRGGGFYNSVSGNFERILLEAYYWESNSEPGSTEVKTLVDAYYCSDMLFETSKRSDKRSVRCIKVK